MTPLASIEKNLSRAQEVDIELCRYFYPCNPTPEQIVEYIALSERGKGKERGKFSDNPLVIGKTRRGLTMGFWEEGVLEGTFPYFSLLGGFARQRSWWNPLRYFLGRFRNEKIPRFVVDFMKREMFKGTDAGIIEKCYSTL